MDGVSDTPTGWCRRLGIKPRVFQHRTQTLNMPPDIALKIPVTTRNSRQFKIFKDKFIESQIKT